MSRLELANTMSCMLRFSGAVERDPAIDVWLNQQPDELGSIAHKWFVRMRQCGDDVRELMHDGCPVAYLDMKGRLEVG